LKDFFSGSTRSFSFPRFFIKRWICVHFPFGHSSLVDVNSDSLNWCSESSQFVWFRYSLQPKHAYPILPWLCLTSATLYQIKMISTAAKKCSPNSP
jgi:hypothetical protein